MRHKVVFRRDPDGWWLATVPAVPGCHTQGRSLAQARERIKEALAVSLDSTDEPEVLEELKLPKRIKVSIFYARRAREAAETAQQKACALNAKAAQALTESWGVSLRDAADLLDLSHQRVAQILDHKKAARRRHAEARN